MLLIPSLVSFVLDFERLGFDFDETDIVASEVDKLDIVGDEIGFIRLFSEKDLGLKLLDFVGELDELVCVEGRSLRLLLDEVACVVELFPLKNLVAELTAV